MRRDAKWKIVSIVWENILANQLERKKVSANRIVLLDGPPKKGETPPVFFF